MTLHSGSNHPAPRSHFASRSKQAPKRVAFIVYGRAQLPVQPEAQILASGRIGRGTSSKVPPARSWRSRPGPTSRSNLEFVHGMDAARI